jgi:hypothetical protein
MKSHTAEQQRLSTHADSTPPFSHLPIPKNMHSNMKSNTNNQQRYKASPNAIEFAGNHALRHMIA